MLEAIRNLSRRDLEERIRQNVAYAYLGDSTVVCKVLGKIAMYVDTNDLALAPHLMLDGFWELWITQAMARLLQPGATVVDVGANFGYYTLLMAEAVGKEGRVFAFEPNPPMMEALAKSLGVNGTREQVTIDTRAAYSTSDDTLDLFIPNSIPMAAGLLNVWGAPPPGYAGTTIPIRTVRLDDVLPEKVDFIKIDVEGAERHVWRGLQKTIGANRDIKIFLEFNASRLGNEAGKFLDEMLDCGFKLRYVNLECELKDSDKDYVLSQGSEDVILYLSRQ